MCGSAHTGFDPWTKYSRIVTAPRATGNVGESAFPRFVRCLAICEISRLSMPKNVLHDIIMTKQERSIRHIPLPRARKGEPGDGGEAILYEREEFAMEGAPSFPWRRIFLWGAAVVCIILVGLVLSMSFTGVTLTVTPKTELATVHHEFTAARAATALLHFEAVPIRETAETTIPADTTKKVSERGSGTIVIYNNFSSKPQRLIKNTRFETADGLIYRIAKSVSVPGTTVKGDRTLPGSVEAIVYADSPGKEYNIPLSDFTVPGFKTDKARFAGFYARSKTPMTGGFDGVVKTASDEALARTRAALRADLDARVTKKLQGAVPKGFILFDGARALTRKSPIPEERGTNLALVRETVVGAAYMFKREDLARAVATAAFPSYQGSVPVEMPELNTLSFRLTDPAKTDQVAVDALRFSLDGTVRVVWLYDEAKLRSSLLGKQKVELAGILGSFPTIERVDLVLRPFWSTRFPDNPKKISFERTPLGALPVQSPTP